MASSPSSSAPPPSSHHQRVMEKPNQELLQQQQEALKCPRCDSSNTKFCYYNNYSLSQPRHFCKACKRYWTRGGTLRNVPVGGGCRKNKRIKRPVNSSSSASSDQTHHNIIAAAVSSAVSNPPSQSHQIDVASTSNHINPLFYGMNLQFPRFNSSSGFDHHHHLQPQMNNSSLGLDFTDNIGYRNGFSSNHSLLSSDSSSSIFANSSSTSITTTSSTAPPIMASLLSSTDLQQQKFINNGEATNKSTFLQGFINNSSNGTSTEAEMVALKEVKSVVVVEDDNNRFLGGWQNNNQIEHQTGLMSDPSSLYWNTAATDLGTTTWHDQTNIGLHQSLLSSDLHQ